jgi:hypothetical protein
VTPGSADPAADLPPRPDPWTGLPVPPPAPGTRKAPPGRRTPSRPRPSPPGRGPVLAGHSGDVRVAVALVGGTTLLALLDLLLTAGLHGFDSSSVAVWVALGFFVLVMAAWARGMVTDYLAVGADWLQSGRAWVDLYDLVRVRGSRGAYGGPVLELHDGSGRQVRRRVGELRADPLMWDLVHLGVRWSRATREVTLDGIAEAAVGDDPLPSGAVGRRHRVAVERVRREDPRTAELPERPDTSTCRPVPPPVPWTEPDAVVRIPRWPQSLPPGRGTLVGGWSGFHPRGVAAFAAVLVVGTLVAVAVAGVDTLAAHPLGTAFCAACGVLAVVCVAWLATASYVAVGADWAADELGWVDLYDLVTVRVARARWGTPALQLTDGEGRRVLLLLSRLRTDLLAGRYVDLGIRWSRATNVVELDDAALDLLARPTD